MKSRRAATGKESVAVRALRGLTELADALEQNRPYTRRQVEIGLEPTAFDADAVKRVRTELGASQALFAKFLGVSVKAVRSWEQGVQRPSNIACRFMDEIRLYPAHWRKRLEQSIKTKSPRRTAKVS